MKKYLLIISALLFSLGAYAQPASDWPAAETGGTSFNFSISNIDMGATGMSAGDIVGIFTSKGGTVYLLGQTTLTSFGFASFSGANTGPTVIGGTDALSFIRIYDVEGGLYYEVVLTPPPTVPNGGFGSYNANGQPVTPSAALPVELTSFTGAFSNNAVTLNWATASEENNEFFTVERSADGKTFEALENISGAGTTVEAQEYQYIDEQPESGVNYYRLKQTDFDENFTYSEVISVKASETPLTVNIFPNPVVSTANITLSAIDGEVTIKVMDLSGREVLSQTVLMNNEQVQLDLNELQAGMYMVVIYNGEQVVTKQIQLNK